MSGEAHLTATGRGIHTFGMKVAVSIPDEVFAEAERLARRLKASRSRLYSLALAEYVARHSPEEIAAAIDRVMDRLEGTGDPFTTEAARRVLKDVEW